MRAAASRRALVVEALVLCAVLAVCLSLLGQAFATAALAESRARATTRAATVASDAAERFCADPASLPASFEVDGLVVSVERAGEPVARGTLWRADIEVRDGAAPGRGPLVALSTARYVASGVV